MRWTIEAAMAAGALFAALAAVVLGSLPSIAAAAPGQAAARLGETSYCLSCHGREGPILRFKNGETLSAHVDRKKFESSVHRILMCTGCHDEFTRDVHPDRVFRGKAQYRARAARICRRCHLDVELRLNPTHAPLLDREQQGKAFVCADCHSAHEVMPISGGKVYASEEKYCLSCHSYSVQLSFADGAARSATVDPSFLGVSAHKNLSCSDCHFGFSSEEHPQRRFRSEREFVLASAEICKRCHFDMYSKRMESIHYSLLSQGRLDAPACTDCHGGHTTTYATEDRVSSAQKCHKCHSGIFVIYSNSVHGNALFNEANRDVPTCVDCHSPHSIKDPISMEYHDLIPEMCSNCHANKDVVGKYGLSTEVVRTYLSDFHGVTLGLYRKERGGYEPGRPIAVCTDCHGTHDITPTTGPEATVVKQNLVKRCRMCHEDATENFPDTWLSHYGPTFTNAPIVFFVTWLYKILMPVMVAGLMLQVFLHIWRYLVNR
jgi:hypothetical protein